MPSMPAPRSSCIGVHKSSYCEYSMFIRNVHLCSLWGVLRKRPNMVENLHPSDVLNRGCGCQCRRLHGSHGCYDHNLPPPTHSLTTDRPHFWFCVRNPTTDMTIPCEKTLIFQDVVIQEQQPQEDQDEPQYDAEALSLAFFELANVPVVGYRLAIHQQRKGKKAVIVTVQQDTSACGNHTGGIVWETSYLLLNYLLHKNRSTKLGRVLEVGAGCGLLGQVLATSGWCKKVVVTETKDVLANLVANLARNGGTKRTKKPTVQQLDWLHYKTDAVEDLKEHSFDTIVGTDVVFTPALVEPLLETLRFMAHQETVVYLCLQIRCEDSHQLLLDKATNYGWQLQDISHELAVRSQCAWGLVMECRLLKLIPLQKDNKRKRKVLETPAIKLTKAKTK
jgi:predicted nicotinamide N-methyase